MSRTTWWRGTGRRRAADRIPALTTERDLWILLALWQAHQLAGLEQALATVEADNVVMACDLDGLRIEHEDVLNAYDEATARAREAEADLANLRAITSPAPIANEPAVQLRDPEATVETPVPLWLAFPPNQTQTAA